MEKTFTVYMHINTINGKIYVGQTCQNPVSHRWGRNGEKYISNQHFYNAIQKYGWDNFEHVIFLSGLTLKEADIVESMLIELYNTMDSQYGYNKKHGGNNGLLSDEAKERISIANKGKKKPDGFGEIISNAKKGHLVSEETRNILREKCSGWHHTEEERRKISEKNTGKHWFNNGIENVFAFECPDGFVQGMLQQSEEVKLKKSEYFSKTRWYTNGVKNIRAIECPEGYWNGRSKLGGEAV